MDAEVVVIGGGPAGSATAALLAQRGHDVLLLDRARFPRDKACAEYLSPGVEDVLRRLGALDRILALHPERPLGMRLVHRGAISARIGYPDQPTARRALCLPRRDLDAALLDHARSAGVRVHEATTLTHLAASPSGTTVTVNPGPPVRARLAIGADGARSVVARSAGLLRRVVWPRRLGLIAHVPRTPALDSIAEWGEMHVGRGAYCGLAPLPGGRVNVGLVMPLATARRAGGLEAALEAGLSRVPTARSRLAGAPRIGRVRGAAPIACRAARPYADSLLLVGDAAGFLDPFTGEGVYRALRGAERAAEAAHHALSTGRSDARALAPYAAARARAFGAKGALSLVIQGLLATPPLLAYALRRLDRRPSVAAILGGALGDYRDPAAVLRPAFLVGLLRP
ncbi:MAG TPA: FAD-dependent oxidoreductase [Chloroflexota bacterium]|nr:FAD-dependent oxidoreductase [Chloroflexota bacterium]